MTPREAWKAAHDRMVAAYGNEWPIGGFATLARIRPGLSRAIDDAEKDPDPSQWERLMTSAMEVVFRRICHQCGCQPRESTVDPDGVRRCPRCARSQTSGYL